MLTTDKATCTICKALQYSLSVGLGLEQPHWVIGLLVLIFSASISLDNSDHIQLDRKLMMMPLVPDYLISHETDRKEESVKILPGRVPPLKQHWNLGSSLPNRPVPPLPQREQSKSVPIQGLKRSPSELRLDEDEEHADYRDFVMFARIVDGMIRSQEQTTNESLRGENDRCLAHVIGTRYGPVDSSVSLQDSPDLVSENGDEYMGGLFALEL